MPYSRLIIKNNSSRPWAGVLGFVSDVLASYTDQTTGGLCLPEDGVFLAQEPGGLSIHAKPTRTGNLSCFIGDAYPLEGPQ